MCEEETWTGVGGEKFSNGSERGRLLPFLGTLAPRARPSPNRSARSDSTALPSARPPSPSFSFFSFPEQTRAPGALQRLPEWRRGGPAATSGSPPPTEAAFISTDEPYGARVDRGGRRGLVGWVEGGEGRIITKKNLTSRQEAICATQIISRLPEVCAALRQHDAGHA